MHPYSKLFKELKNGIGISVDQVVFKLKIKKSKCCLDQLLKNCLAYLNFDAEFLGHFAIRCILFFENMLTILR